jgi:hypothetical protein
MTTETRYIKNVKGDGGNWYWPASFDMTRGYLGITQGGERVLLSPSQLTELIRFAAQRPRSAKASKRSARPRSATK